jgi:hypothetical protein
MALKGDRIVIVDDISLTCESATARGVGLCYKTGGSGVALGDKAGQADLYANPSGQTPAGVLLNDVVNVDVTRYHMNFHKDETLISNRCVILKKGRITTDQISGTPTVGNTAYLTTNGQFTPTVSSTGGLVATPKVGQFVGSKDEAGFACIDINLPVI